MNRVPSGRRVQIPMNPVRWTGLRDDRPDGASSFCITDVPFPGTNGALFHSPAHRAGNDEITSLRPVGTRYKVTPPHATISL